MPARIWPVLAALGLLVLVRAGADEARVPPVEPATDQSEALRLARRVDLPALETADRVAIAVGARRIVVDRPETLKELRTALKPSPVPPSAGETVYTLSFRRGATPIRTVWVFASGEWGFERPEGPSWTIGREPALARLLGRAVAPPK